MTLRYFHIVLLFLTIGWASCHSEGVNSSISVCDKDDVISPKLISVNDAAMLMASAENIIPIEVSKSSEYQSGHLTNAINVWRPDFRSKVFSTYKGMICNNSELEYFLQNLGVTEKSQLLLYDHKGGCDAMRLSWVFDCYGVDNYQVINGGKKAWIQAGHLLDTMTFVHTPNPEFKLNTSLDTSLYAFRADVLKAIDDDNTIIVDTRELYEYEAKPFIANGEVCAHKNGAFTRGSIPGSIHFNWSTMSDLAHDHRIKCTKDLLFDLEAKGITKDKNIIVYCQSGSRSSHTAFVLREVLGYTNVKNYDGSWIEWSYYHVNGNQVPISRITTDSAYKELYTILSKELSANTE